MDDSVPLEKGFQTPARQQRFSNEALRFKRTTPENKLVAVAVMGERDQHVHRFLWRSMETNRDPDVYVNRVLAFGDKPAPAMVQVALRKTAQENKADYPEAAEVLTNNVYTDDICESKDTVKEARKLTEDVYEVLRTVPTN